MREGWEIRKLGDLADLQRGLTYSKGDEVPFSSKRVLRSNNIDLERSKLDLTELKYLREDFAIPEDRKVKKNSIFICMSNGSKQHVGKVAFIDEDIDYAFGGFMGLIVPKSGIVPKYVFFACQSSAYRLFLSSIGNGIGITNLRFTDLANYSIPVPPIQEQEKIVAELDSLSGIIEKKKQQLEELDRLAQSIFYDMFGDPISNEKGWPVKRLGEIAYIGLGFTHSPEYVDEGGVPFISVKDISGGEISFQDVRCVSEEEYLNAPKGAKPQKNDIVFCRVGTMGKPVIVKTDRKFCTFVSVGYLHLQQGDNNLFVKQWMESPAFDKQVEANVRGGTIKNLNTGWLKNFILPIPPLDLQNEFAKKIDAIEKEKELVKRSIVETETLFNSRMDYWFS